MSKKLCERLALMYGANVIQGSNFRTGECEVFASLRDGAFMWKSSKSRFTTTVTAKTTWEARRLCAEQMLPGVESNPNPISDDDWLD